MSVSIVIPTYNRKAFERLIEYNINSQDYFNIIEIIVLDDSDIDRPLCIRSVIPIRYYTVPFEMETNNKTIAGSADMNMWDGKQFYKQRCMFLHLLNEATMVFKKSAWSRFADTNSNEAVPFLEKNMNNIVETNIDRVMCCVCHKGNTVDKTAWLNDKYKSTVLSQYSKHIEILSSLNI